MKYSPNEKADHRAMKEKTLEYVKSKLKDEIIVCEAEHYLKRAKGTWMKSDVYIETTNSVIIIEAKTSGNRQGLLQLLNQMKCLKTNKKVILILACFNLGKLELKNFADKVDRDMLKGFRCVIFDEELNIKRFLNDLNKFKTKDMYSLLNSL